MLLRIYLCYIVAEMKEPAYAVQLESLFMALADKTRLRLLNLMSDGEVCVGYFTEVLGDSQPKISRHLAYLRSSGLVDTRRDGKRIHYSIRWPEDDGSFRILKRIIDAMETSSEMLADRAQYNEILADSERHTVSVPIITSAQTDVLPPYREAHNELEEFLL
jgi:ArsR family transcriptional regulator, arsenate/arsenite/antimonite-responsive transcriptional repressor